MAERHFVDFFGSEVSHERISTWDTTLARTRAATVLPRPFGFRFSTWDVRSGQPDVLLRWSQAYFFGGSLLDVVAGGRLIAVKERGRDKTELFRASDSILAELI